MGRKSKYTDEQIIRALKEVDAGSTAKDVCRKLGVTEQTFYRWKAKYGGMEVSEAKRLRQLEAESSVTVRPGPSGRSKTAAKAQARCSRARKSAGRSGCWKISAQRPRAQAEADRAASRDAPARG